MKILITIIIIGSVYFFVNKNSAESGMIVPERITTESDNNIWWDNDYSYRRKILVNNYEKGLIEINHAQLNLEGKTNIDGSDLKIIGQSNSEFIQIPFEYNILDAISTKLAFDPGSFKSQDFYLYYGNKGEYGNMNISATKNIIDRIENTFSIANEEKPIVQISSLKKWLLIDSEDIRKVNIKISSSLKLDNSNIAYLIDNGINQYKAEMKNNSIDIDLSNLKPGIHEFFIVTNVDGQINRSNSLTFKVSEPIYIAWTLDWEGVDPNQEYLDKIADISSDYNIKITHFFNPRIFINLKIDSARKKQLLNWVKNRHDSYGEEIAMHLHMHHDMVEEAGVKAKYNAKTWDQGSSGYDTPSTEYDYDEYLKILKWGLNKMKENGLPEPKGFRAGGWFANLNTLRAIQDAGFKYDSSARISQPIGQNKLVQDWEITTKTQPYKISQIDQSSSILPTLDLYELPNNGLDSYWSETDEMLQAFYDNYTPGTTADKSRIVTYLSHPEWFYIDDPKLRVLYTELNKYRIDFDNGPVKFITLSEWMDLNSK